MVVSATDAAEAVEKTKNDWQGVMTDLQKAKIIELLTGPNGKAWVNVDGICFLRINYVEVVYIDTSNALSTDKVV